jgi:hypothetical protein
MTIKIIHLCTKELLISKIEEVPSELGEPDCKLVDPYLLIDSKIEGAPITLEPWMSRYTSQNNYMIHSDKILTIADPKPTLIEKYEALIK